MKLPVCRFLIAKIKVQFITATDMNKTENCAVLVAYESFEG
jgi:hypothetical protein